MKFNENVSVSEGPFINLYVAIGAVMPGDDASVLTPGRMKKEVGVHSHNKDLITSSTLSPGANPGHGESINKQSVYVCVCVNHQ